MEILMKIAIRPLLLAVAIGTATHTIKADYYSNSNQDAGAIAAIIGGCAAACYGIYKLIDWCTTPTNEQLLQQAQQLAQHYHATYEQTTATYKWIYYSAHVTEDWLAQFASDCYKKDSVNRIIHHANDHLEAINNKKAELYKRVASLKTDKNYQSKYYYITQDLEKAAHHLDAIANDFKVVVWYMNDHKAYLLMWECTNKLWNYYQNELNLVTYDLGLLLGACINHSELVNKKYPLLVYIDTLNDDIRTLERSLKSVYSYPIIYGYANNQLTGLKTIRGMVASSNRYAQEQNMKEQDRIEAERQKIAKEQLRIQQEQLEVQQAKLREMERQNAIAKQQLYEQRVQQSQNNPQIIINIQEN